MNLNPEIIQTGIRMIIILSIFISAMILLIYMSKKLNKKKIFEKNIDIIKIIDSKYFGIKKNISLFYVPEKVIVVGITNDHINLLTEINDKDIVQDILKKYENKTNLFSRHLQKWSIKFKEKSE